MLHLFASLLQRVVLISMEVVRSELVRCCFCAVAGHGVHWAVRFELTSTENLRGASLEVVQGTTARSSARPMSC